MRLLLTIFFIATTALATATTIIQCNNTELTTAINAENNSTNKTTVLIHQLYSWCIADSYCSDIYYQTDVNNITVFKYMVANIIETESYLNKPLLDVICSAATDTDIMKNLWLLMLTSMKYNQSICDINHILVIDKNTLTSKCICKPNRQCDDEGNSLSGVYAILIIILVILILNVLINKYKSNMIMDALKKGYNRSQIKTILSRIL